MFQRFTAAARATVVLAQQEARDLRQETIGTEHLLLGLLGQPDTAAARVLTAHGLTREAVLESLAGQHAGTDLDHEALSALGIDLDAVRERVEAAFGPGALDGAAPGAGTGARPRFGPRAKKVLELALREAIALHSDSIADGHVLLGLLREGQGLAAKVLADRGVDPLQLRREIIAELRR